MSQTAEVLVKMTGIDKYFPGVHALNQAQFELRAGEVHALVGENGAGKSTLMKVLTGIYSLDAGEVLIEGRKAAFRSPIDAQSAGITMVHQELNMMGHLTVAQNIFAGREKTRGIFINDKQMIEASKKLFDDLKIDIDPKIKMSQLTVGKQQMCEIAKAISHEAKVIIFDEPTAALTESEIAQLFRIIRDLRAKGYGIVYISHRMDEIHQITDRVTVMRDGQYIGTKNTDQCTKEDIINMMVGRTIYETPKTKSMVKTGAKTVLKVERMNAGRQVQDVSFELYEGEILGFAGLMGAGRTETLRALFGADIRESGEVYVEGQKVEIRSPQEAVNNGISYLSEDRKRYGVLLKKDVRENSTIATMQNFVRGGFIDKKKELEVTNKYIDRLRTKTPGTNQLVMNLSGGNQQKVVIAKWLVNDSKIMIFDEPTRGIDVGAKQEIYELMNELTQMGKSIIMISSDLVELLRMSDRVIVMCEGKVTGEFDISEASQEKIMHAATRDIESGRKEGVAP